MTPSGHLAVGFAAKRRAPAVPLALLLVASCLLDILFFFFVLSGFERQSAPAPWSHGLLMSVMWSLLTGFLALGISGERRVGATLGLVVFSHWMLDFVSWNNLPLFLRGSRTVGLGLIHRIGGSIIAVELAMLLAAVVSYVAFVKESAARKRESAHSKESETSVERGPAAGLTEASEDQA